MKSFTLFKIVICTEKLRTTVLTFANGLYNVCVLDIVLLQGSVTNAAAYDWLTNIKREIASYNGK